MGAYCERIDEQLFTESILERIYNQIVKADIIIADMTNRNPNVFYETGNAHALGKRVILLTQDAEDIPFDMKHYPHIIYQSSITYLKDELKKRVEWAIQYPRRQLSETSIDLEFSYVGLELATNPIMKYTNVLRDLEKKNQSLLRIPIDIHNKTYDLSNIQIGIILPAFLWQCVENNQFVHISISQIMIFVQVAKKIYPNG